MADIKKQVIPFFTVSNMLAVILCNGIICLLFYAAYQIIQCPESSGWYHSIYPPAFFLVFIVSNFWLLYNMGRKVKQHVSDTEMKALRSQMNPHFIFNSLNSINDYIDKHDTATATLYTTKFSKLMRMILENSEKKVISLSDDLKALELYMQLEALRMNNKFTYTIKVDESIDQEATQVPPLILQPFVENSILHGIASKQGKGHILIEIKKEDEMINYIVEDDGVGRVRAETLRGDAADTDKKSLGMKITKARIDIMNKIKNTQGDVELADLEQGTRVKVKLPLELSF